MIRAAACLAALALLAGRAEAEGPLTGRWECKFTEEQRCDPGRDCADHDRATWMILDIPASTFTDCWVHSCMAHPARFDIVGRQVVAYVPSFVTVLTLSPERKVTEARLIGELVFFRRGRCTPAPPAGPERRR